MNKEKREKISRIELRTTPSQKEKIKRNAEKCNLSVSSFIIKRALGYEPKVLSPEIFFDIYNMLCDLCNSEKITPQMENMLIEVIDEIQKEILMPKKEDINEWRQQDSGPSKID